MISVDVSREPFIYPNESVSRAGFSPDKTKEVRQAFNRAFNSYAEHYGRFAEEVATKIQDGKFDWERDSWARFSASGFFCTLEGVNALRQANQKAPWKKGEDALDPGDLDTFPVRFRLAKTGLEWYQREGVPMRSINLYLWQLAFNPDVPLEGDHLLACHDLDVLDRASHPYLKLHPEDEHFGYTIEDRIRLEAFLTSTDPLRQSYDPRSNWVHAVIVINAREEFRLEDWAQNPSRYKLAALSGLISKTFKDTCQ